MKEKIFTISNCLSVSRIFLMIPALYVLYTPFYLHREVAVLILLVGAATDALDGYVARKLNQVTELGKVIDPLADKIGVGILIVTLVIFGDIPLWFTVLVLGRDLIIFIAGLYIKAKTGIILPSLMSGKVAVSFLAFTLVLSVWKNPHLVLVVDSLIWISVATLAYSFLVYGKRFFETLKQFSTTVK
jgi:CDP-diacylglycerol--glycerol-3-phosphate 3-phosphatidyltransferase